MAPTLRVRKRFQHFVYHPEMARFVLELLFQVDQVSRGGIESLCQELREFDGYVGFPVEERHGIVGNVKCRRRGRGDRRGVRGIQEHGEFAENRSSLIDVVDLMRAFGDFDGRRRPGSRARRQFSPSFKRTVPASKVSSRVSARQCSRIASLSTHRFQQ